MLELKDTECMISLNQLQDLDHILIELTNSNVWRGYEFSSIKDDIALKLTPLSPITRQALDRYDGEGELKSGAVLTPAQFLSIIKKFKKVD